uniref:ABC transporter transmembrane domain-containing protein n=1 Tax=Vibrio cholerae TaxID=666 RepID=UPI0018F0A389|nr:hypothetical protein [Vibrio cholerae]
RERGNDVAHLDGVTTSLSAPLNSVTTMIGAIVMMMTLNWKLSFAVIFIFPVMTLTSYVAGAVSQRLNLDVVNVRTPTPS